MTWEERIEATLSRCKEVLLRKEDEYATEVDRFHNFRVAANLLGTTPRAALASMMSKHTISVYDMAMSHNDYHDYAWDEKICDHINYLLLLRALIEKDKVSELDLMENEGSDS